MEGDEEFGFGLRGCIGDIRLCAEPLAALELTITVSRTHCHRQHDPPLPDPILPSPVALSHGLSVCCRSFSSCSTELSSFQGMWQESSIGLRSATGCNPYHELPHLEAHMARSLYASFSFSNSFSSHHVILQLKGLVHRSFFLLEVCLWLWYLSMRMWKT